MFEVFYYIYVFMDMKYVTIILLFVLFGCSKKESNVHFSVKQLQLNLGYSLL